ncbi:MAG: Hsp70 family protein, partial [Verrucomicrobiales bacterium]|nr:Hsp70 family protein [Verrucomicrobiales bacterium]
MKSARYLVGIDLGTANCAMACADLGRPGDPVLEDVPIPQVLRPGETGSRALLPSCVYLADPNEFGPGTVALPWAEEDGDVVGEFARWQGARVPGRLVTSAKSWLCHSGVDRTADLLPWGAPAGVPRVSPVVATARILKHLVRAWDAAHPDAPLSRQELVLAVPASFDAVARALTVDAARLAGLSDFTLVEEPQAAFEAFVWERRDTIASALDGVRSVLVVDVGGGTTDFTLVDVSGSENGPEFRRVAVGEHLILGGDNMDVALARRVEEALTAGGRRTTPGQWGQLVQACREGKEALLGEEGRDEYRASLAGSGSALLGSTVPVRLTRGEVESVLLDGFFGTCSIGDRPRKSVRTALREVSLPFAQDPSIPRQLAGFLAAHGRLGAHGGPVGARPDAMLLNGGVFRSRLLADRLLAVVSGWWPDAPPVRVLPSGSLDLAVARGAVCHGLARRGKARKVTGGSAHAIYVGLEAGDDGGYRAL